MTSSAVTAAGIFHGPDLNPAHLVSVEDFVRVLQVNLVGTFAVISHALPSLVDGETLSQVRAETDRFEDEVAAFLDSVDGGRIAIAEAGAITFTTHLVARSEVLRALSLHPTIAGICDAE